MNLFNKIKEHLGIIQHDKKEWEIEQERIINILYKYEMRRDTLSIPEPIDIYGWFIVETELNIFIPHFGYNKIGVFIRNLYDKKFIMGAFTEKNAEELFTLCYEQSLK